MIGRTQLKRTGLGVGDQAAAESKHGNKAKYGILPRQHAVLRVSMIGGSLCINEDKRQDENGFSL
jgi:hypothetical protein